MERVIGIEPTLIAWKAIVLPLNYTRDDGAERGTWTLTAFLPQDFKSCASTIPPLQQNMVSHRRLELRTPSLKVKCSTTELVGHGWVGWIRTTACQNQNLMPYRLATTQLMVDRSGFEPLKPWVADLQSAAFGRFAICP